MLAVGDPERALAELEPALAAEPLRERLRAQLMLALSGGPGCYGHDGWLTYECSVGNGIMVNDSIEVDEAMYPILIEERRIATDSMGFGQWNGAPATFPFPTQT